MKSHLLSILLLGTSLTVCTAQAAVITWGAATTISGDSDVSTTGTLVEAFNMGPDGETSTTVNGVTFDSFVMSGTSVTVGNVTVAGTALAGADFSSGGAFSALSLPYQNLLELAGGNVGAGSTFTLTLSNLTAGSSYEFQWWVSGGILEDSGHETTATAGNSVGLNWNPSGLEGGVGQFAIGTFVADNASQVITFTGTGTNAAAMSGMQYRQFSPSSSVPDHGATVVMLGLAIAGLFGVRRRLRA